MLTRLENKEKYRFVTSQGKYLCYRRIKNGVPIEIIVDSETGKVVAKEKNIKDFVVKKRGLNKP